MLTAGRNGVGLTEYQVERCKMAWDILCRGRRVPFDTAEASLHNSRTRFNEDRQVVFLGADAYAGMGLDANSRMSMLACLAHELSHAERFQVGYRRPTRLPDSLIDEAEASLHASFTSVLKEKDREDLVEDARDRLIHWIGIKQAKGKDDEN